LFANASFDALDAALRAGSPAIGAAAGGGDAGAVPYTLDVTAPRAVTDLVATQVYDKSLLLTWTAPGDDGGLGTASAYDLRWSAEPITAANFAGSTPFSPQPIPASAGTTQSYFVDGRVPGQTYYYAIIARDEAGNAASLGNVLQVTMPATDQASPDVVRDLAPGP
jgi:hypothetical protein